MQAAFGLEPLPGEAGGGQRPGRGMHPAKGRVDRRPDLGPRSIRRKHRPPDVVGMNFALLRTAKQLVFRLHFAVIAIQEKGNLEFR